MAVVSTKVVDIANSIRDLSVTENSIAYVAMFIRDYGIGQLNNLLQTTFYVDDSNYELNREMTIDEMAILHELYEIFDINRIIKFLS